MFSFFCLCLLFLFSFSSWPQTVDNRTTFCHCSGPSGSCTVQTCYQKAPSIEAIGETLRRKYNSAQKVVTSSDGGLLCTSPSVELDSGTLVYINDNHDLCTENNNKDILGTKGRLCNPNSSGTDGCLVMCCNRGYNTTTYTVREEVCEFDWCCEFVCSYKAPRQQTDYRCL